MRHRNAGVGGAANRRRDAGNNLELDAGRCQLFGFLTPPTEDKRIPALEPHHALAFASLLDEQAMDLLLRHGVGSGALADEDQLRASRHSRQNVRRDEGIGGHHIR